jgi:ATP-dependent 26S proteasome regulatory subunit
MAAFAGGRELITRLAGVPLLDLASLFAEANNVRDTLVEMETLKSSDPGFRAGYESTEHMVLKGTLLRYLRAAFPGDELLVEQDVELPDPMQPEELQAKRHARPDLRIAKKLWVEVETLRGLSLRGSNPFFALENKLRNKLEGMKLDSAAWLIVPTDVALLAPAQVCAIARNLSSEKQMVKPGFVDLVSGAPVGLEHPLPPRQEVRLAGASWREARRPPATRHLSWEDVAGYDDLKRRLTDDVVNPLLHPERYARYGAAAPNGLLLYGLPGCGKSLVGRVLAGLGELACRLRVPSDLTSMWLGEGVAKTRAVFDWALKQPSCLLILDELDGVAPQRNEVNMHSDEKRQVNELLTQLDRVADKPVMVVATTNYVRGIDVAIRRSGRFDLKIPVLPPNEADRKSIFAHYLQPSRCEHVDGLGEIDTASLAAMTVLFTPADIRVVVETTLRRAIAKTEGDADVVLSTGAITDVARLHQRSIQQESAVGWLTEARAEVGASDDGLGWLEQEISRAYGQ